MFKMYLIMHCYFTLQIANAKHSFTHCYFSYLSKSTFTLLSHFTHLSTQWPIVPLSHLCRNYHNTFSYSFFIHLIFTLYSLTTLFLLSHTTSFTFSLQSRFHTYIFTFQLYLTYAMVFFSITPPNFTLCSYHFTLISHKQTLFTLLTHFTPYFTILSYSS